MENSLKTQEIHFNRDGWMITYGSLLTGVLAFFLLLVGRSTSEAESIFKFTDNLTAHIGKQLQAFKAEEQYDWLYIENTGNKGIKILIPSEIEGEPAFYSASADITPEFLPYLDKVIKLVARTDLTRIYSTYELQISQLNSMNRDIDINLRIEGHTDRLAIKTDEFNDNWELSTARANSVMKYFQKNLDIGNDFFSMAGYAYFHPLHSINNYDENRRVEIYIKVNMLDLESF